MELPELDARAILSVLVEHGVRFVLIGGMAAIVHGSPFPTEDVDLTPEASRENLARLSDALRELDARVRAAELDEALPFNHDATSLAAVSVWNLVTPHGVLDISFVPTGTDGYADLARDAVDTPIFGLTVKVASLADIIRSKQAANRLKDQRVLPTLREILARRNQHPGA
jgi:predicted nucleotidyltransferase